MSPIAVAPPPRLAGRVLRRLRGQLLGVLLMPGDLLVLLVELFARLRHRTRPPALAERAAASHRRRHRDDPTREPAPTPYGERAVSYLGARVLLGTVDLVLLALMVYGFAAVLQVIWAASFGHPAPLFDVNTPGRITWLTVLALVPTGTLALFMGCAALWASQTLDRDWWQRCVRDPDAVEQHLRTTRAEAVEAVDGERRRIERDLHDGAQQGLVSLGMLLGQAKLAGRDDSAVLLEQAHRLSLRLLTDLRTVVWQVYPVNLDQHGLVRALEDIAAQCSIEVVLTHDLAERPPHAVETAAYFVAAEAVTNAMKHTDSARVWIDVRGTATALVITVTDQGSGGAVPDGAGLTGLRQRVAALDGTLHVDSPVGGPTRVTMEAPCR